MSDNYLNSDKHKKEHSHWDRRGFLKVLGIAGAGSISLANSHLSVINSNFISALSNLIINKKSNQFSKNLFPPKTQCPSNFKKCPCLKNE